MKFLTRYGLRVIVRTYPGSVPFHLFLMGSDYV